MWFKNLAIVSMWVSEMEEDTTEEKCDITKEETGEGKENQQNQNSHRLFNKEKKSGLLVRHSLSSFSKRRPFSRYKIQFHTSV